MSSEVSSAGAKNTLPKAAKQVSTEERGQKAKDNTENLVAGAALDIFRKAAEDAKLQDGVISSNPNGSMSVTV